MDALDQLKLIRQARKDEREDLQEIADANIGNIGAAILSLNAMRTASMLDDADPNTLVDVPEPAAGGVIDEVESLVNPI